MEPDTSERVPVPLHELSANQLNQLDPFRLFYVFFTWIWKETWIIILCLTLFLWNILRDDPSGEETNELDQFVPIGKLDIV